MTRPSPTPQPNDPVPAGPYTRHLARKFGTSDGQNTLGAKHPGATYTTPLPLLCVHMIWAAERRPWRAARVSHSSTQAAAFLLRREGTRVGVQQTVQTRTAVRSQTSQSKGVVRRGMWCMGCEDGRTSGTAGHEGLATSRTSRTRLQLPTVSATRIESSDSGASTDKWQARQ